MHRIIRNLGFATDVYQYPRSLRWASCLQNKVYCASTVRVLCEYCARGALDALGFGPGRARSYQSDASDHQKPRFSGRYLSKVMHLIIRNLGFATDIYQK